MLSDHHSDRPLTNSTLPRRFSNTLLCILLMIQSASTFFCHSSCNTCSGEASTQCLTCASNRTLNLADGGSCQCIMGYYEVSQTTMTNSIVWTTVSCQPCHPTCRTCTGPLENQCLSCEFGASLSPSSTCKCSQENAYQLTTTGACFSCHYSCQTCFGPASNQCEICYDSATTISSGVCTCTMPGMSISSSTGLCTACYETCSTCNDQTSVGCLTCLPLMTFSKIQTLPGNILVGECVCTSSSKTFISSSKSCTTCDSNCLTCSNLGPANCLSCKANAMLLSDSTCVCKPGFVLNAAEVCSQISTSTCHNTCATCRVPNSSKDCLTCKGNAILAQDFSCPCYSGYYLDSSSGNCLSCNSRCKTCYTDNPDKCSSCNSNNDTRRSELSMPLLHWSWIILQLIPTNMHHL